MVYVYALERHVWAWIIAAGFAGLAVVISLWSIRQHLKYNSSPVAKYEIRILLMVPVYAVCAWLGLYFKPFTLLWDVFRECYEALAIYSFYQFLLTYLGGSEVVEKRLQLKIQLQQYHADGDYHHIQNKAYQKSLASPNGQVKKNISPEIEEEIKASLSAGKHPVPCCCIRYRLAPILKRKWWRCLCCRAPQTDKMEPESEFQRKTRRGVLQYVPIKLMCAVSTFLLQFTDYYHDGEFQYDVGYPYVAFVTNASQLWALYCLVIFYNTLAYDLKRIKPLYKFLAIKLVVFATFWQGVLLAFLVEMKWIVATHDYNTHEIALSLQDFIVCIEMFVVAIAHIWIFDHKEFPPVAGGKLTRLASVASPKDIVREINQDTCRCCIGASDVDGSVQGGGGDSIGDDSKQTVTSNAFRNGTTEETKESKTESKMISDSIQSPQPGAGASSIEMTGRAIPVKEDEKHADEGHIIDYNEGKYSKVDEGGRASIDTVTFAIPTNGDQQTVRFHYTQGELEVEESDDESVDSQNENYRRPASGTHTHRSNHNNDSNNNNNSSLLTPGGMRSSFEETQAATLTTKYLKELHEKEQMIIQLKADLAREKRRKKMMRDEVGEPSDSDRV